MKRVAILVAASAVTWATASTAEVTPRYMGGGNDATNAALASIPTENIPDVSDAGALEAATSDLLPMTPEEIRQFRSWKDQVEKAAAEPVNAPLPRRRTVALDLSPGSHPPVIQVRPSFDTSLTILDQTGKPWPIERFTSGNNSAYPVKASGIATVIIKGLSTHAMSNLTLHLQGMRSPVTWTLLYGDDEVDYEVTGIVPTNGPETNIRYTDKPSQAAQGGELTEGSSPRPSAPSFAGANNNGFVRENEFANKDRAENHELYTGYSIPALPEDDLVSFMDGIAPEGAVIVPVAGDTRTRAWIHDDKLVLRSPHLLVSPKPSTQINGDRGYFVYVTDIRPVLVVLSDGSPRHLQLSLNRSQLAKRGQ